MERRRAAAMENHTEAEDPVVPVTSSANSAPATIATTSTAAADTETSSPAEETSSETVETARSRPRPRELFILRLVALRANSPPVVEFEGHTTFFRRGSGRIE
ncbi:unnamed protein product [Dibothriocephalus latus]|uniref:Uncharacterized protein n=1 Tax=Dibothriocephalus latus TaxID=60516 RepID=A0A3P7LJB9_DIBLA|nr:unnamed protein product [Dibothriocephalus latus]